MEPFIMTTVGYVSLKLVDQFIKEEGYGRIKRFFFPKKKYIHQLSSLISATITEHEKAFPYQENNDKFPFYQSQILFEELSKHILFKTFYSSHDDLLNKLKENSNIIIPTKEELDSFYSLLVEKINNDQKLEELFIEENYKNQIFGLSEKLESLAGQLGSIDKKVEQILTAPEQKVGLDPNYINKEIDQKLIGVLHDQDVLLLTGLSFCGKTETAKKVAETFVAKGFEFRTSNDLGEAARFLRGNQSRIYILEDPFGHDINTEAHSFWKSASDIIQSITPTNKLIITSRIEILKSITGSDDFKKYSIKGYNWIDLTNNNRNFLRDVWDQFCRRIEVPSNINQETIQYLETCEEKDLLQPGQLEALARLDKKDFSDKPLNELIRLARQDSLEISRDVERKNPVCRKLFTLLGISTETFSGISISDLNYIVADNKEAPGISEERSWSTNKSERQEPIFPNYPKPSELNEAYLNELGFFQARGFINIVNSQYYFSHPNYREAARYLINTSRTDYWNDVLIFFDKSICSLNPGVVKTSLKNLEWLLKNEIPEEAKKSIIELLYNKALRSIFPGIKDRALTLLINYIHLLDEEKISRIYDKIQHDDGDLYIGWKDNYPFLDEDATNFLRYFIRKPMGDFNDARAKIKEQNYSTKDLYNLLDNAPKENGVLTIFEAKQLLNADEAFIRAKFASYNLQYFHLFDEEIIASIFKDDHPSVVFAGVKAGLIIFPRISRDEQAILEPYILSAFKNQYVIIRSNNLITTFGIDYGHESVKWQTIDEDHKTIMWELWSKIICLFLINVPKNLTLYNSGRFTVTIQKSAKYISAESGLKVATAYFDWFQKFLHSMYLPSELSGVMYYLLELTQKNNTIRIPLFKRLLETPSTSFILTCIPIILYRWSNLTNKEQEIFLAIIRANRTDDRWIKAAIIVSDSVPEEIQEIIFNDKNFLNGTSELIYKNIDRKLLEDALGVVFSKPYIFDNLSVSNQGSKRWTEILKLVLRNHDSIAYDLAVNVMLYDIINSATEHWREDGVSLWKEMCEKQDIAYLTDKLIEATIIVNFNIDYAHDLWEVIIENWNRKEKIDQLYSLVIENFEGLQYHGKDEMFEVFGRDFLVKVLERTEPDNILLQKFSQLLHDTLIIEDQDKIINEISALTSKKNIRFHGSFIYIDKIVNSGKIASQNLRVLKNIPNVIYEKGRIAEKKMEEIRKQGYEEDPSDWIKF